MWFFADVGNFSGKTLKISRSSDTQNDHMWRSLAAPQETLWQNFRFSACLEGLL